MFSRASKRSKIQEEVEYTASRVIAVDLQVSFRDSVYSK